METKHSASKHFIALLLAVLLLLGIFAGICIYFDPLCHYHAPLPGYDYSSGDEFYMNNGIIRNFDYDGIVTGSSVTENFKASEAEQLFGGHFIKVPLTGASLAELSDQIKLAYSSGKDVRNIITCIDTSVLIMARDEYANPQSSTAYLRNDLWIDDINYLFNFDIFAEYTFYLLNHRLPEDKPPLDFDEYCSWEFPTGKEAVFNVLETKYTPNIPEEEVPFTPEDREKVIENVRFNITDLAREHPETTFYCFYPPFSICIWEIARNEKHLHRDIETQKTAAEELLTCPNIKLFGFDDHHDIICDLNYYHDPYHYNHVINSRILEFMREDVSRLTPENYLDYFDRIEQFYTEYDYAALHE